MNRIEIVGLFSAMEALCDAGEYEKLRKVINDVLTEARDKTSAVKSDKAKKDGNK